MSAAQPSAGFFALCIGLWVLIGWAVDDHTLKRIAPHFVAKNPATAACIVVLGLSLLPMYASHLQTVRRAAGLAGFSVGLLKLADIMSGSRFGIDEYLFASKLGSHGENPMAESTAVMFLLLGAAATAFTVAKRWAIVAGQVLAAGSLLLTFLALIGHILMLSSVLGDGMDCHGRPPEAASRLPTA